MIYKEKYKKPVFFLIGYSGVGKTTLAKMLKKYMDEAGYKTFLFDADDMSKSEVLSKFDGMDIDSRYERAKQLTLLVNWIRKQDIIPIVSVIGQPEKARDYWRNKIDGYVEIYLKCSLDECIKRDNKKIYNSSSIDESNSQNVVGIDIEFEEPKYSDIVLNAEINSSNQLLKKLIKLIKI